MTQVIPKKYPTATPEVAKMFGINFQPAQNSPAALEQEFQAPVFGAVLDSGKSLVKEKNGGGGGSRLGPALSNYAENFTREADGASQSQNIFFKFFKALWPYLAVFAVGLALYYFFFTNLNFGNFFHGKPKIPQTKKDSFVQNFQKQNLQSYTAWISQFYFEVSDQKVLDPDTDNSGNGLTNFQKYLLNLNPKAYDTLGLGLADSEALAQDINPLTGNRLAQQQKQIAEKYIDMEIVMNRFTLAQLESKNRVAGTSAVNAAVGPQRGECGLTPRSAMAGVFVPCAKASEPTAASANPHSSGQPKRQLSKYIAPNTGPANQPAASADRPVFDNPYNLDADTSLAGRLEIADLGISAPIIWTKNAKNFNNDLKAGVVHYPGTALPGQLGTAYISGHSSNYVWAKGNYNQIFSKLGDLPDNTPFKIILPQKGRRDAILHYVVTGRKEFSPKDQAQFENGPKSIVALSTCWPVGTTQKRLVVFGELTQVEQ